MAEILCKIRTRQSGMDPLWESEMRRRRAKTEDAAGRASWRSSFLGAPGARFFCRAQKFLGTGATSPPSQDPHYPGEMEGKFKLQRVCPRKTVSLWGCTSGRCAQFCAPLQDGTALFASPPRRVQGTPRELMMSCSSTYFAFGGPDV